MCVYDCDCDFNDNVCGTPGNLLISIENEFQSIERKNDENERCI